MRCTFVKNLIYLSIFGFAIFSISCERSEETFTTNPNFRLAFSSDSIVFDTVFSLQTASDRKDTINSVFKRLLVYNTDDKAINIERIQLTNPAYTAIVNGEKGNSFENIKLFGKDSLQLLVSVNVDPSLEKEPIIISDQLSFITNGNTQNIAVVSYAQNAIFLDRSFVNENTTWTAARPYILTDTVFVNLGVTLTIEAGTQVYSDNLAGIFIGGNLIVNGTLEQRVLFRNLRTGGDFDNLPGQWTGLVFGSQSHGNRIVNADIRNAVNGIFFGAPDDDDIPDLVINNCKIENMASNLTVPFIAGYGILAFTSDIEINNTLINHCATSSIGLLAGGNYSLNHCTLDNSLSEVIRNDPTAALSNFVSFGNGEIIDGDLNASITNSIIWGSQREELTLGQIDSKLFNVIFENNIIRTTMEDLDIGDNLLNENPLFVFPREYDYHIEELSPAIGNAVISSSLKDLDGIERGDNPDIGTFEYVIE
jgi:hypothetical protein